MPDFDTLIIGAGTAGSRLATRLALQSGSQGKASIGLIEAGGLTQPIRSRVPAWYPWCFGSSIDWAFQTVEQVQLNNRRLRWPRGRLLGGSGAINALIDIQSSQSDWNRWGWIWAIGTDTLDLPPRPELQQSTHRWTPHFLKACQQYGLTIEHPLSQASPGTCGDFLLARAKGVRIHTGQGLEHSSRIQLIHGAVADRILFAGSRAIGVRLSSKSDGVGSVTSVQQLTANRIVLCAGTVGSPELLLRSGIGPRDELKTAGIDCRVDLPGVGKNLQDHLVMPIVYRTKQPDGLPRIHGKAARQQLRQYGAGSLTSNIAEATALVADESGKEIDFQIHFTPNHYWKYPFRNDWQRFLSLNVTDLHPQSRGEIRLERRMTDGSLQLTIDPCYLSDPEDVVRFAKAFSSASQIAKQPALAELIDEPLVPAPSEFAEFVNVLSNYAQSIYHPIGTCAMQSPSADYEPVINERFQVLGTENLWVADASVLPDQPSCNPNRTVILLADRLGQLW